jgi:hypothetical protein
VGVVNESSKNSTNTTRRDFAELVAPLEQASGRRLGDPHRQRCLEAFHRYPDGVREVAKHALADAESTAVGLFVYRIQNGWHELPPLPSVCHPDDHALERWLRSVGVGYAHDRGVFAEEIARFGVDAVRAEELRRKLQEAA